LTSPPSLANYHPAGDTPLKLFPHNSRRHLDPRRAAILLIGGDKTGQDDFYTRLIPLADRLYDEHLAEIAVEEARKQDDGG